MVEINNVGMSQAERDFLKDLVDRMQDMEAKSLTFKGLLYGNSGIGKTVAAVHLAQIITPKDKLILYVDSASNWDSMKNHPKLKKRVKWMNVNSSKQLEQIARAITNRMGIFAEVGCVIIDEHSSIAEFDLLGVTEALAATDAKKDEDVSTQPDMGISTNRMKKFTAPLAWMPDVHLILVAHERVDKNEMAVMYTSPKYMPNFNSFVRGLVSFVGHMEADEYREDGEVKYSRKIQVMPTPKVTAKTRVGGFSGIYTSPIEMNTIIKEWLDGKGETLEEDKVMPDPVIQVQPEDQIADELDSFADLEEVISQ